VTKAEFIFTLSSVDQFQVSIIFNQLPQLFSQDVAFSLVGFSPPSHVLLNKFIGKSLLTGRTFPSPQLLIKILKS